MDLQLEMAKAQATLNNLIAAVYRQEDGEGHVDVLGSLLALADQMDRVDKAIDSVA